MQADLKALEFDAIRRLLERLSATPYGADAARSLEPAPDLRIAKRMQRAVSAARRLIDAGRNPLGGQIPDIRAALRQAASVGAALNSQALFNIQLVMQAATDLDTALTDVPDILPEGEDLSLCPPQDIVDLLDKTLVGSGTLREDASEALAEAFAERARLREQVMEIVTQRMRREDVKDLFKSSDKPTWHNERAALTLNAAQANTVKGVRRATAMGGRDVIIEPMEAVPVNNALEAVNSKITAEQQRLLREITAAVRARLDRLEAMVTAITWVDLALAAGQLSHHMGAHPPRLVEEAVIELSEAYHPLLLVQYADGSGPQPVPLSLRLDAAEALLLITGPNTGGKTVALKTLGLLTVMAHCGLHIPAEGDCRIGHYTKVIVDVGDHQSLYHHLSTFAGHVEVLKRILDEAGPETLVLLDELGTGTDPDEGAALAMAVLDELVERRVQGVVNTHLSPLKDYAEGKRTIRNACMQFDHEQLRPTFRLKIGEPGVSLGLTIAQRNGLPEELIARARDHLNEMTGPGQD